jgi:glutaredoxin
MTPSRDPRPGDGDPPATTPPPALPRVTLYGKPGCHLCDEARAVVAAVRAERSFELDEVDVSLDPVLHRRYGERIPVIAIGTEDAFEYVVDARALRERLDKVTA